MKTELLIMAAGMGSRFGGLKQIEPVGPRGEIILDFSIADAKKAGFDRAVFVIKKKIEKEFREAVGKRIEAMIDVSYVFQELNCIPAPFTVPETRQKPWGTAHAVLCAKDAVKAPFAVINADDFYGQSSYRLLHDWLVCHDGMCMVGYRLGNTLTENGSVSRGVCEVENGLLKSVTEHTALDKYSPLSMDTIVSMNMWGLDTGVFDSLETQFAEFLSAHIGEEKAEFFLPNAISRRIRKENRQVAVIESEERWYGVTYREDKETVCRAMQNMIKEGLYT